MCGEHKNYANGEKQATGSSPRVRGTHAVDRVSALMFGIIPACAGNTPPWSDRRRGPRDHPRVCGEHNSSKRGTPSLMGSSPRVRGTLYHTVRDGALLGIIPACAGNTRIARNPRRRGRDHPRVCGEHYVQRFVKMPQTGSSPRVRGTHIRETLRSISRGIIPACAGNTEPIRWSRRRRWDHPRVCGEHGAWDRFDACERGSSPRVRGTLGSEQAVFGRVGIIPACAGNTHCSPCQKTSGRDHPRVCGEHPTNGFTNGI